MKNLELQERPIPSSLSPEQKIVVRTKTVSHVLSIKDITHLVCDCYLTTVYTKTGEHLMVAKLLKEFEQELEGCGFVRVNRNTMINVVHVTSFATGRKRTVQLSNSTSFVMSRRGMGRLKEHIEVK
ncbi:MAG: LytTR family transcriptional regulator DNA-binding domain-containing protein [Bacteroidales bacterium]|nr:LytTR family transcriptional regulator DNA-binding domain-containing protein [Bacteroidales bacterium]MBN2749716.1 LytTR family transcriptional regulator DNA-binding domain-containing protein [Bacteroidales bacterium]